MDDKAAVYEKSSQMIPCLDVGLPAKAINSVLYDLVPELFLLSALSSHNALQKERKKECHEARVERVHTGIVLRMPGIGSIGEQ